MHLEILVEEPSMEEALKNLLPQLLPPEATFQILPFQGKRDLLNHLPARMRGYSRWIPEDFSLVVLVDEDRQNCLVLKQQLEEAAVRAGLSTKTSAGGKRFQVLNRIAVEELEAWFFGDVDALRAAYPRIPATFASSSRYRDPDAISGGTWEALERLLQRYGYYRNGYAKVEAAREISKHMDPSRNQSRSFQVFCEGVRAIR